MADGGIVQVEKDVAAYLKEKCPLVKQVQHIAGVFDENMAKRLITAPWVLHLSFSGAEGERQTSGVSVLKLSYVAWVAGTGKLAQHNATNLLEQVALALANMENDGDTSRLSTPFVSNLMIGAMEPVYDNANGVTIYGLAFGVEYLIGQATFAEDITIQAEDEFPTLSGLEGEDVITDIAFDRPDAVLPDDEA